MRIILVLFVFLFTSPCLQAQKNVSMKKKLKQAYTAISKKSGQDDAERMLVDTLASMDLDVDIKAEGYYACAMLQHSINEGLNMKAYLRQDLDTVKLYQTVLKIYEYTLLSDSFDIHRKYEKKNARLRTLHRKNVYGGGRFMLRKSKWDEAYSFFDMFLRTSMSDNDSILSKVSYWATVCGMNENNPWHVIKHVDTAIRLSKTAERAALTEYKARSYMQLGDSIQWLDILSRGVDEYPGYGYFYLNLMDYYQQHGMVEQGILRTDSLMQVDEDRTMYWFALSMFALEQEDYSKCIAMSDECIRRDSSNVDAYYNKGISLLNMALAEKRASERLQLYGMALEPMERVRELEPDNIDKWGNPLYRIYLNLNMGRKFEEIDRLLDQRYGEGLRQDVDSAIVGKVGLIEESASFDKGLSDS